MCCFRLWLRPAAEQIPQRLKPGTKTERLPARLEVVPSRVVYVGPQKRLGSEKVSKQFLLTLLRRACSSCGREDSTGCFSAGRFLSSRRLSRCSISTSPSLCLWLWIALRLQRTFGRVSWMLPRSAFGRVEKSSSKRQHRAHPIL